MEAQIKAIIAICASLAGAIFAWMSVLKPLFDTRKARKAQRQRSIEDTLLADKEYRQTVLSKLDALDARITGLDDSISELQRDNIERAYCMFVMEHGYCPSGMKGAIADLYDSYSAKGHNHIARSRVDELLALPEFPP